MCTTFGLGRREPQTEWGQHVRDVFAQGLHVGLVAVHEHDEVVRVAHDRRATVPGTTPIGRATANELAALYGVTIGTDARSACPTIDRLPRLPGENGHDPSMLTVVRRHALGRP